MLFLTNEVMESIKKGKEFLHVNGKYRITKLILFGSIELITIKLNVCHVNPSDLVSLNDGGFLNDEELVNVLLVSAILTCEGGRKLKKKVQKLLSWLEETVDSLM